MVIQYRRLLGAVSTLTLIFYMSCIAPAGDWAHFRGPHHNGITDETDWNADWGDSGPQKRWEKSIGIGYSSLAVAEGRVYTMGHTGKQGNKDVVFCLDAQTGRELWTHRYDCPLEPKNYEGGPLSTPTVDAGKVYTLSKMGDLFCLDAFTGKVLWQKQLHKTMGYELPTWHFSSSAVIVDDKLVLNVGDRGLALNKVTGDVMWMGGKQKCGYATPVPTVINGQKALVIFGKDTTYAVRARDGKTLWQFPWKTYRDVNAADPILSGNQVFVSSSYGRGCGLWKVQGDKTYKLWESKVIRALMSCLILHNEYVYGFDERTLKCIRLQDGSEQWRDKSLGKGSLIMSKDGRLIIMSGKGELVVAQAQPNQYQILARAQILPAGQCGTAPVLANGKIYARNAKGDMVCVDVGQ